MREKTKVWGLTGPSGSGKSTVAAFLRAKGVPVLDADAAARRVVEPGEPVLKTLSSAFGSHILRPDGSLDRKALAREAFAGREQTDKMNRILHPVIMARMEADLDALREKGHPLVILDAPQLYEAGADRLCDGVLAVLAPAETRLGRIMARDGITEEEARQRMAAGLSDAYFRERGARILYNDKDKESLERAAAAWLQDIWGE